MVKSTTALEAPEAETHAGYSLNSVSMTVDSSVLSLFTDYTSPVTGSVILLLLPEDAKE